MHQSKFIASLGLFALAAAAPSRTLKELASRAKLDSQAVVTGDAATCTVNDYDGVGAGSTNYTPYSGDGSTGAGWPARSDWVSFDDMFNANMPNMQGSCGNNNWGDNDSGDEINNIKSAIEQVAQQGCVDHRFILAVIMQESGGCVRVPTTANGFSNPGLMQCFQGYYTCHDTTNIQGKGTDPVVPCPSDQIFGMIREGAVGTDTGDGLASNLNSAQQTGTTDAQSFYYAARLYNSGSVCNGDLSNACGATQSYAADIANRLTGWVG